MSDKFIKGYAGIGQFSIAFNTLDAILTHQLRGLIGASERAVAIAIVERAHTVSKKLILANILLTAIGKDRKEVEPQIKKLASVLSRLDTLSRERNDYVHSLLTLSNDPFEGEPEELYLRTAKKRIDMDEKTLEELLKRTWNVATELQDACFKLQRALDPLREPKTETAGAAGDSPCVSVDSFSNNST